MSEHDFSDGELDVDGICSPHASNGQQDDNKRHARAQHNALERRRRDNIKDMYTSLREEMPNFTDGDRASRAQILKKTIEQIQECKDKVGTLDNDVRTIQDANERLRTLIAEKEAAVRQQQPPKQNTN